jgi:phenylacetate-CoA ligase
MTPISPLQSWIRRKINAQAGDFNRDLLEGYQLDRVRKTLSLVKQRSHFYRELLASSPDDLPSMDEFSKYPFTTAADIQQDPNHFVCVSQDEIQRIVTLPTSGTTGPPKRIFFTAADQELTIDFFHVGMSTLANPGDRVLILLPGQRPGSVGDLLRLGLERLGCMPFPYGPVDDEETVLKTILEKDINIMVGAPVQIHQLATWDLAFSSLPKGQVQRVLCSTDILSVTVHQNLERIWGCEVFDHYGMTETGLGGGVDCEAHQGYHLREADLYYEIINPVTGEALPDGESGEVVVTTLTRMGMPLVRYRTGDLSRLIPGVCPCGSFVKRLAGIQSRMHSGVETGGGVIYPADLDNVLFKIDGLLDYSATLEIRDPGEVLTLIVRFTSDRSEHQGDVMIKALMEHPLIRDRLETGALQVLIDQIVNPVVRGGGLSKRRINRRLD